MCRDSCRRQPCRDFLSQPKAHDQTTDSIAWVLSTSAATALKGMFFLLSNNDASCAKEKRQKKLGNSIRTKFVIRDPTRFHPKFRINKLVKSCRSQCQRPNEFMRRTSISFQFAFHVFQDPSFSLLISCGRSVTA